MLFRSLIPNSSNAFIWINTLFMLIGLFFLNWKPEVVVIAYFLETIIIGIIHVFKMIIVLWAGNGNTSTNNQVINGNSGFMIPFFIFHYFFFIYVQSIFIFQFFSKLLNLKDNMFNVFSNYNYLLSQKNILIAFIGIAISNVALTYKNFILSGVYKETTVSKIFGEPYGRIIIQQFVAILAGFIMFLFSPSIFVALLLIIIRLVVDLKLQYTAKIKNLQLN